MPDSSPAPRLGTRRSALAMWQANWTRAALEERLPGSSVDIVKIVTAGDRIQNVRLAEIGGKGLFTRELDDALLDGRIDMAVHSLKDLPFDLPGGVVLAAIGKREDPRDAMVSDGRTLDEMPHGARIGTSSLRRQSQLLARFPGLDIAMLRGNVDTRLRKLSAGEFDGIILAAAGLKRLGHADRITQILEPTVMLPAIGQGALAFVCRSGDESTRRALDTLDDPATHIAAIAERGLMASLEGSCQVPIAGHAVIEGETVRLKGLIASLDGTRIVTDELTGPVGDAFALGRRLGRKLRASGGEAILDEIRTREH